MTDKNDPDGSRRRKHAEIFYAARRNSQKAPWVKRIAQNSGMSEHFISKIFDHIFIDKHDIYGELRNFDPSYDMAESFRRLYEGKDIQPHDLILLKHERLELRLMQRYGCGQSAAHILASKKYNYAENLRHWKKERDFLGET
ncbi:MAG: hypothetical protein J5809_02875 [Selenomonadaceae bacterium]|nr:hypothetical protein [Selenomonadaceae bacterium]